MKRLSLAYRLLLHLLLGLLIDNSSQKAHSVNVYISVYGLGYFGGVTLDLSREEYKAIVENAPNLI